MVKGASENGLVGEWNLEDIIKDRRDLKDKFTAIEILAARVEKKSTSLTDSISSTEFVEFLEMLEKLAQLKDEAYVYAYLRNAENTQSDEASTLFTKATRMYAETDNRSLPFKDWWMKKLDDRNFKRLLKVSGDLRYYLERIRKLSKYSLSLPEEKIMNITASSGTSALDKIYTRVSNGFQYEITLGGKSRTLARDELMDIIEGPSAKEREAAYQSVFKPNRANLGVLYDIYQSIVLDWKDRYVGIRGYESPISARNMMNDIGDEAVSVLLASCRKNSNIFKEYFKVKAKAIGIERLRRYDIYAPVKTEGDKAPGRSGFDYQDEGAQQEG